MRNTPARTVARRRAFIENPRTSNQGVDRRNAAAKLKGISARLSPFAEDIHRHARPNDEQAGPDDPRHGATHSAGGPEFVFVEGGVVEGGHGGLSRADGESYQAR